jgi:hypothetical protein
MENAFVVGLFQIKDHHRIREIPSHISAAMNREDKKQKAWFCPTIHCIGPRGLAPLL